ncbi:MAG TPA: BMC domain-containing protein [Actinomycetota bacterium]|nr:BMC domain-containing protein [Actinomycetota bacterium]
MEPAVCLLEFSSIAKGIEAGDAMVKRAPLQVIRAGTVHPGRYLVLVGGLTADVEEAMQAGREVAGDSLVDIVFLPDVHPDVVASIGGARREDGGEALGVIETTTVAAAIDAADAGVKGARVTIRDLRLADDLGGKGYVLFGGDVAEVEAAVGYGVARTAASGQEAMPVVISRLHDEMRENLTADPRFGERARDLAKPSAADNGRPTAVVAPRGRPLPGSGGSQREVHEARVTPKPRRRSGRSGSRARRSRSGEE